MFLAIDIGNTNIVVGIFNKNDLILKLRMSTDSKKTFDEYRMFINYFLSENNISKNDIKNAAISSVVPELNYKFSRIIEKNFNITPFFINNKIKLNISFDYENPDEIGADRIVNSAAAFYLFNDALIVLDFGTATTIEYITEKGVYKGGLIIPGLNLMKDSLHLKTAKLPDVNIQKPENILGKNTVQGIQNGIYFSTVGGLNCIIEKIKQKFNTNAKIIATGGLSNLVKDDIKDLYKIEPNLTLVGLNYLFRLNNEKI